VRGLLVPAVLALVLTPAAKGALSPCGGGTRVLDVSYRVQNDVDTGVKGNNWAFDSYTRVVRVWRKAPGRFCSASTYNGEFTTLAGWSPGGKTQLPAGIRGTFKGTSATTFRGKLAARGAPLRGFLGVKDFSCTSADRKGRCSGTWDWLRTYFTGLAAFKYTKYSFTYKATENGKGTWSDALSGGKIRFSGDIRADKKSKP
jgi:hypothetical protein